MSAKLLEFPPQDVCDISKALRNLADDVEAGKYGDAHNLAWIIDCGNCRIEVGLIGPCGELAPSLHYLMSLGLRKVETAADG